ncbi:MAG: hypothetical protein CMB45_05630 [Euryarchaeota archaeon]|mgnify:FL=1|nr:hypothetical protein [Euryarchaeota archaeon]MBK38455.1 hypothetical protein [Euryarchaeota archaeon]|tara:strand:+ start:6251 stop:11014 length:4764 start_codon:yes stop_codon:yes gene_type:complete
MAESFFWYARPEDFDESGALKLTISAGRLRHRWVPRTRSAAKLFLREHPDAHGLRVAADNYILVNLFLAEPIEDLSEKYPNASPKGINGIVIKTPFEFEGLKGNRTYSEPPFYISSRTDMLMTAPAKQFSSIEMGLATDEDILSQSVTEISVVDSYTRDLDSIPNGPCDIRLGSVSEHAKCGTCSLPMNLENAGSLHSCAGHFGHISLATPVPKFLYLGARKSLANMNYPTMTVLNRVCFNCGLLSIPNSLLESIEPQIDQIFALGKRHPKGREEINRLVTQKFNDFHGTKVDERQPCPHCESFTPKIKFNHTKGEFFFPDPDERFAGGSRIIDYRSVYDVLLSIPDTVCKFLALDPATSRPENLFWGKYHPVSPNTMRPSMQREGSKEMDLDDLTMLYADVVFANDGLRTILNQGAEGRVPFATKRLYHAVSRVADNHNASIGSGGTMSIRGYQGGLLNVSYKGIMNRLGGKKGRFRNNLQSKYVEDVSYSTIAPDSNLSIDEVGVPLQIAMQTTYDEKVTEKNIEEMRDLIRNGPDKYPGALYVIADGFDDVAKIQSGGSEYLADYLQIGAIVKRHIIDGDWGLFNRAPSLHRQSILGLRVRVTPDRKQLSMNPTICIPFNADYDGDAMKMHFVNGEEARDEAENIMGLAKNIIHARFGKLTVATDQDQTSGLYLLTHTDKARVNEWNPVSGLGFTEEGIPYLSKPLALSCYSTVYSEIRDIDLLDELYKRQKKIDKISRADFDKQRHYRHINSLPESDCTDPDGNPCYTGRAIFSHLFSVVGANNISATFKGNTPMVDEDGTILRENGKKVPETVIVRDSQLIQGTLEKDAFGEGGSSLAPAFIYHFGYERGQEILSEYIELVTRLGFAGHRVIGYTMGTDDVSAKKFKTEEDEEGNEVFVLDEAGNRIDEIAEEIDTKYAIAAAKIEDIQQRWNNKDLASVAYDDRQKKISAELDPVSFLEEEIFAISDKYESDILVPIENAQGSGNPMQIAVRSRARGKDLNVRQMAGSYGMVLVGGKRIRSGINNDRVLAHYPKGSAHPRHSGFIKSNYSKGMQPDEYWLTSTAGRRSTVESGQGNISESGYLERKMVKGMESHVVNQRGQVYNLRTGRVISPRVGEDGLAPYHIRGTDRGLNTNGLVITLQPLLFEHKCTHKNNLAEPCEQCELGSSKFFMDEVSKLKENKSTPISKNTLDEVIKVLTTRKVSAPVQRKLAKRLNTFWQDSQCRIGEAIGATAAGCLGEPATQAALRTFHFAGKMSFQGTVSRTRQILESPLTTITNIDSPRTLVRMRSKYNQKKTADKVANLIRKVEGKAVIDLISYDVEMSSIKVQFNMDKLKLFDIKPVFARQQVARVLDTLKAEASDRPASLISWAIAQRTLQGDGVLDIALEPNAGNRSLLIVKEALYAASYSGFGKSPLVSVIDKDDCPDGTGRYTIDIRAAETSLLNNIEDVLSDIVDMELIITNNLSWIYQRFGLEATLWAITKELDFQMNGGKGSKGVGEYDWRYTRTIADMMGEEGIPMGLGPAGLGSAANYSILAACSVEGEKPAIVSGSVMGNFDPLDGIAESVVAGKLLRIGNRAPN